MEETPMNHQQEGKVISRKLILFPIPWQGHVAPMLHLADLLYSKSFSITFIQTRYSYVDPERFPHFTFHFLGDGVSENMSVSSDNFIPGLIEMHENYREPFRVCLGRVLNGVEADSGPFSCLISDSFWLFAGDIAESFNLRTIVLRTSSMSAFVVNDYLPYFRDKGYFLQGSNPDEPVQEIPPFKIKDLPKVNHDTLASVVHQTKTSHGVICNSFEELESFSITRVREILSIPIFPIGPLHKYSPISTSRIWTQDQTTISWLDKHPPNSVLYVSFGSLVGAISTTEFGEIIWALANSNQPFLWAVRSGLSQGPDGFLEWATYLLGCMVEDRGRIVIWAPQVEVLAHPAVGGFLSHCGWNSTIESITEGVPMLCLPFFFEQPMNGRHVTETWKTGLVLENGIQRDEIEKGIRRLMVGEEGEAMRSRAANMKELARHCLMEGGSSSKALDALTSYLLAS